MLLCAYACPLVVAAGAPHVTGTYHPCRSRALPCAALVQPLGEMRRSQVSVRIMLAPSAEFSSDTPAQTLVIPEKAVQYSCTTTSGVRAGRALTARSARTLENSII